jgi:hypothetical protein
MCGHGRWAGARWHVVIPLGVLFLQGCQYDPYAHTFTTAKPETSAVAGRYVLTKQTVVSGGLTSPQVRPCAVELAADGTFTATNVPPRRQGGLPPSSLDFLVSGSGTWRLAELGTVAGYFRKGKRYWGVVLESRGAYVLEPARLTGDRPPYGLIFTVGDGDAGAVMILQREEPAGDTRGRAG